MRTLLALLVVLSTTACRYNEVEVQWNLDYDGDGTVYADDCDDEDPDVHPGASELCNGEDDDCDGTIDEEAIDPDTFWVDGDGDGYGNPEDDTEQGCTAPEGYSADATDCDDDDPGRNPGMAEEVDDG
ncbi:MAG: putative metal-binding motif-containing protein, partial [Deltaproteobacteria bacterium]|nr:putative metal-binding motif-containing protein [Deltaproteobacteria bacterium]